MPNYSSLQRKKLFRTRTYNNLQLLTIFNSFPHTIFDMNTGPFQIKKYTLHSSTMPNENGLTTTETLNLKQ